MISWLQDLRMPWHEAINLYCKLGVVVVLNQPGSLPLTLCELWVSKTQATHFCLLAKDQAEPISIAGTFRDRSVDAPPVKVMPRRKWRALQLELECLLLPESRVYSNPPAPPGSTFGTSFHMRDLGKMKIVNLDRRRLPWT